ncbi:hypothetical protein [Maridesulfovibrio sp.]|uniref:hypothetical protein n=1 Tax=Maridesulfovibrio sp. TaxID=2795000 RepID=UPI0029F4F3CE|nr:hypothetical protein [Maridesulfovibrio sp.]
MCTVLGKDSWCDSLDKEYQVVYIDKDGERYCIFHAPEGKKYKPLSTRPGQLVNSEGEWLDVDEIIKNEAQFKGMEWFASDILFSDQEFSELVIEHLEKLINKTNQEEIGTPCQVCSMTKAIISSDIDFTISATISEYGLPALDFSGVVFVGKVKFGSIVVNGTVNFDCCEFKDEILFGEINRKTKFLGGLSFKSSTHAQDLNFDYIEILDKLLLDNCECNSIYISDVKFEKKVSFDNAKVKRVAFIRVHFLEYVDLNFKIPIVSFFCKECYLSRIRIDKVEFRCEAVFEDSHFCERVHFNPKKVFDRLKFVDTKFLKDLVLDTKLDDCIEICECSFKKITVRSPENIPEFYIGGSECIGRVEFNDTIFDNIKIVDSQFRDFVFFKKINITSRFEVLKSDFSSCVYFIETIFEFVSSIQHVFFQKSVFFNKSKFHNIFCLYGSSCSEVITFEGMQLSNMAMVGAPIEQMKFQSCYWEEDGIRTVGDEVDLIENNDFAVLEDIFRRLKRVYQESKDELEVSAWHYKEKEMIRKDMWINYDCHWLVQLFKYLNLSHRRIGDDHEDRNEVYSPRNTTKRDFFTRWVTYLYWFSSGYGENPLISFVLLLCICFVVPFLIVTFVFYNQEYIPWFWFVPYIGDNSLLSSGVYSTDIPISAHVVKKGLNLLATINAALFAFALRNKLRR